MSESDALGEGTCDAYAGTAAHSAAEGSAADSHASCNTPMMPVGPL
jgi:hypothetical protein